MAGFYYFLEGLKETPSGVLPTEVVELHRLQSLSDCLSIPAQLVVSTSAGPSGRSGHVLFAKAANNSQPRFYSYNPDQQTWIPRGDNLWIGWDTINPPTPEDLLRRKPAGGMMLTDEFDRKWCIPVVRSPVDRGSLPLDYTFDPDGSVVKRIKPIHERVWELSGRAHEYLMSVGAMPQEKLEAEFPEEWVIRTAVEFLGINYRIGLHEAAAFVEMGATVLDTDFAMYVFRAVTDFGKVEEATRFLEKKNQIRQETLHSLLDSQKHSPGSVETTTDTDQPVANS